MTEKLSPQEEKQFLANEVYAIVEKLNRAFEQAGEVGLNVSLWVMPGLQSNKPTIQISVVEVIPFPDPKKEKSTSSEIPPQSENND